MAFFTKNAGSPEVSRLYVLDIELPSGMKVIKIGKSSGHSSLDRMLQIQRSYYHSYRTTFICNIKRDRKCEDVFKYETELHRFFSEFSYKAKVAFDGSTELFAVPISDAVEAYEYLLDNGLGSLDEYEYELPTLDIDELPF